MGAGVEERSSSSKESAFKERERGSSEGRGAAVWESEEQRREERAAPLFGRGKERVRPLGVGRERGERGSEEQRKRRRRGRAGDRG